MNTSRKGKTRCREDIFLTDVLVLPYRIFFKIFFCLYTANYQVYVSYGETENVVSIVKNVLF